MKKRVILTGVFIALFVSLTGCVTAPQVESRGDVSQSVELKGMQRFNYLLQLSGGQYLSDPALTEYISVIGNRLVRLGGYSHLESEFYLINSSAKNAWVDPHGRISVSRGMLLALDNEAELAALLGHLLSHAANQHHQGFLQRTNEIDKVLLQQAAAHIISRDVLEDALEAMAAYGIQYSGAVEQEADREAIRLMVMAGYDPQAAVDLQRKFLNWGKSSSLWLRYHATNQERLAANRQAAHGQIRGLMLAKDSYQKAIANLVADQVLYDQLSAVEQLLQQGKADQAYQRISTLMGDYPERGELSAMVGEALLEMGELANSLVAFDQAIARNPSYYLFYLRHGELSMMEGDLSTAEQQLQKSVQLLPTVRGYRLLAELMERQGKIGLAYRYFEKAGRSDSEEGQDAAKQAKRVDFSENPDRYIHIKHTRQSPDTVMLFITNINPYPVNVKSLLLSATGKYRVKLDKQIPSGQSITSTVTIKGLSKVESVQVDKAELIQ